MPDLRRVTCRSCRKPSLEVGPISWRGNCTPCALRLEREGITGMATHSGPVFQRWRERVAASVGAVVLDDQPGER